MKLAVFGVQVAAFLIESFSTWLGGGKNWVPDKGQVNWVPANDMRGSSLRFEDLRCASRFLLYSMAIIGNNTRQMPGPDLAERVKILQRLTKRICVEKIESFV